MSVVVGLSDDQTWSLGFEFLRSCNDSGADRNDWLTTFSEDLRALGDFMVPGDTPSLVVPSRLDIDASQSMVAAGERGRVGGQLAVGVVVCLSDRAVFTGTVGVVRAKRHSLVIPYDTIRDVYLIEYLEHGRNVPALEVLADRRWGLLSLPKFDQTRDLGLLLNALNGVAVPHWGNFNCDGELLDARGPSRCPECGNVHKGVIAWTEADREPSGAEPDHASHTTRSTATRCESCNAEIDSGDRFCHSCGTGLAEPEETVGVSAAADDPLRLDRDSERAAGTVEQVKDLDAERLHRIVKEAADTPRPESLETDRAIRVHEVKPSTDTPAPGARLPAVQSLPASFPAPDPADAPEQKDRKKHRWSVVAAAAAAAGALAVAAVVVWWSATNSGGTAATSIERNTHEPVFSVVPTVDIETNLNHLARVISDRLDSAGQVGSSAEVDGDVVTVDPGDGPLDLNALDELVTRPGQLQIRPVLNVLAPETSDCDVTPDDLTPNPAPAVDAVLGEYDYLTSIQSPDTPALIACYMTGPTALTGEAIESARATLSDNHQWFVNPLFKIGAEGIDRFNSVAAECYIGTPTCPTRQLAIIVDGEVITAPTIMASSFDRDQIQFNGSFDEMRARALAAALDTEPLPDALETCTRDCRATE